MSRGVDVDAGGLKEDLFRRICSEGELEGLPPEEIARMLGVSFVLADQVSRGRGDLFSLDMLLELACRAGLVVRMEVERVVRSSG